jgi:hypothetical protein
MDNGRRAMSATPELDIFVGFQNKVEHYIRAPKM